MARLHEYQGKAILAANGFAIPRGRLVSTANEAVAAAPGKAPHITLLEKGFIKEEALYPALADEYGLECASVEHAAVMGLRGSIGKSVVLDALESGGGACRPIVVSGKIPIGVAGEGDGGRLILFAADPEQTANKSNDSIDP